MTRRQRNAVCSSSSSSSIAFIQGLPDTSCRRERGLKAFYDRRRFKPASNRIRLSVQRTVDEPLDRKGVDPTVYT